MVKASINFTERITIPRNKLEGLELKDGNFSVSKIHLEEYDLPTDAEIFFHVYKSGITFKNIFKYGTVGNFGPPRNTDVSNLDIARSYIINCKLLIVDPESKIILAQAGSPKGFPLTDDQSGPEPSGEGGDNTTKLLPVGPADINQVWKLDIDVNGVQLLYSDKLKILNMKHTIENDWKFKSVVFPEIVDQIFKFIYSKYDQMVSDWADQWITWGAKYAGPSIDLSGYHPDEFVNGRVLEDSKDWRDQVSSAIEREQKYVQKYISAREGEREL